MGGFRQFAKFFLVGAMNTAIDWGILNILLLLTRTQTAWGYAACKVVGFCFAMANSYYWNKKWVFKDAAQSSAKKVSVFVGVNLIGLGINAGIASLVLVACTARLAPGQWQFLACSNIGAAIATAASLVWNFTGYRLFVFKTRV